MIFGLHAERIDYIQTDMNVCIMHCASSAGNISYPRRNNQKYEIADGYAEIDTIKTCFISAFLV